ncbi:hypothetical protein [Kitasatospora sp. NPDC127060]|uniref:hypothetical protein n=1 Tax=Kitasatospora sp. NPDC127060 TaxID=3347121 RepID=UPI0036575D77
MDDTEFEGQDGAAAELCDLCGEVIADGSELYFVAPDSSVVHLAHPERDGQRWIVACSREHGRQLVEQYRARPFVEPELWAGKIARALAEHPDGLSPTELAEKTGLTPEEVERGARWQAEAAADWYRRFGGADGPPP